MWGIELRSNWGRAIGVATCALLLGACTARVTQERASLYSSGEDVHARHFVVLGDWGSGLDSTERVARRMCKWRKKHPFDLVITTGDNIYPDGASEHFESNFFDPFDCLLDAGVKWHSVLGNHDVITDNGTPELNEPAFGMPRRNYVLRASGVRFVLANSNRIRRKWLRRATKTKDGDRWTVVSFHHPVYSPGDHGSTPGFADWMPALFERRGVDLVVNGHDHIYAVTRKLNGVRYVVTGGGGASLYDCHHLSVITKCVERHHFLYVKATDKRLIVRAVAPKGAPFHEFTTTGN
jgi:UDP-2,3-diacylglucosamine pyrophosphatase LpxH